MKNLTTSGILLTLMVVAAGTVWAQPAIHTRFESESVGPIVPGHRTLLEAQITDNREITTARCYFSTVPEGHIRYVPMAQASGSQYRCILPALSSHATSLEYFFLVVNGDGLVVRSSGHSATISPQATLPPWQRYTVADQHLSVFNELDTDITVMDDVADSLAVAALAEPGQRYGFLVGLYTADEIPVEFNAVRGYFGGFVQDAPGQAPRPVEGFAIGLGGSGDFGTGAPQGYMDDFSLPLATPDVNGSNWSGYYAVTGTSTYTPITASIYQSGSNVEVVTSKSGMGHRLSGTINSSGYMYMYDHYDGEIWTTHYGPATSSNVRLYDYVCPTCSQLYVIALTRPAPPVAPKPPSIVAASNGLYLDKVEVAWSTSLGATSYQVYRCTSQDTGSCTHITDAATSPYVDTDLESHTTYYYRVKACSSAGCSNFSSFGIGYKKIPEAIMPLIYQLLFE